MKYKMSKTALSLAIAAFSTAAVPQFAYAEDVALEEIENVAGHLPRYFEGHQCALEGTAQGRNTDRHPHAHRIRLDQRGNANLQRFQWYLVQIVTHGYHAVHRQAVLEILQVDQVQFVGTANVVLPQLVLPVLGCQVGEVLVDLLQELANRLMSLYHHYRKYQSPFLHQL